LARIDQHAGKIKIMIHFCYDTMSDPELGYPNLAKLGLGPDEFDVTWPRAIAFRLLMYLGYAQAK